MSHKMAMEDVDGRLAKLIAELLPGEEITLTAENRAVARIIAEPEKQRTTGHGFGACKGMLEIVREDQEHLADFKEYM